MPFIDFQELKARVSIEDAASKLGLKLAKSGSQLRMECPACGQGGPRGLAITPSRNLFYCFASTQGGDQLALVAHITGTTVQEAAEWLGGKPKEEATRPPARQKAPEKAATKPPSFDPAAFLEKLEYTPEVEALCISQEDAKALGIGMYRGKLYVALRYTTGGTAGYASVEGAKLPAKLIPLASNVVKLRA